MDETGGIINDSSGNNHTGTIIGNPLSLTGPNGFGNARSFDGIGNYINIGDLGSINLPVSISAWINVNKCDILPINSSQPSIIFRTQNINAYAGFSMYIQRGCALGANFGDNGTKMDISDIQNKESSTKVPTNQWVKVAAIIRGAKNMTLYINGQDAGGTYAGTGGNMTSVTNPAAIGGQIRPNHTFWGAIDEVKLYRGALSQETIQSGNY
jgi:hypothetical protein